MDSSTTRCSSKTGSFHNSCSTVPRDCSAIVGSRKPEEGDEVQVSAEYNPDLPMKWTAKSVYVHRTKNEIEKASRQVREEEERRRQAERDRENEAVKQQAMAKAAMDELNQVRQQQVGSWSQLGH